MTASLWSFILISLMVITTPGPDTAMTIRATLLHGRAGGFATALGVAVGQIIWVLATSVGLVAVLLASEPLFNAIKLAGAAYLIWLGVQTLYGALKPGHSNTTGIGNALTRLSLVAAFRQGLLSDLGNPKMAIFFASILPQFAPAGQGMLSSLVLLGLLFIALTFAWLALYAIVVASAGNAFRRSRLKRALEGLMGAALVGFGLRLAHEQR